MKMPAYKERTNNVQITSMMPHAFRSEVTRLNVQKLALLCGFWHKQSTHTCQIGADTHCTCEEVSPLGSPV